MPLSNLLRPQRIRLIDFWHLKKLELAERTYITVMKKALLLFTLLFVFTVSGWAQEDPDKKAVSIDQILETDANHNLNVAWQYFKLRKAYKAVLMRTDETIAAHPTYSKIDEIFYLHGMSSYYLSTGKGKQKLNLKVLSKEEQERFADKRLQEDALVYLSMLVEEHPKSKYVKKAKKILDKIQPATK